MSCRINTSRPPSLWGVKDAKLPPADHQVDKPFDKKTDPLAEWKMINREMTANPPMKRFDALVRQFKTIGIGPGMDVTKMDAIVASRQNQLKSNKC
ncbi:MAG: hypothetical protein P8L39_10850 [Halioglobus sp.]|nr:hypothetical protein [Halioglobus sp.]